VSADPADGTPALRRKLLSSKPSDFGLVPSTDLPHVWAVMMEMRIGKADVSLVTVAEGSTSLYFSTGGGIIGGGEHDSVRAVNRKLLVFVERNLPMFVPIEAPLPVLDKAVSFAVLTYEGFRGARDVEARIQQRKSPLWPAYYLGQEVITAMRLAPEKRPG
jgi:hypothetical protein